MKTLLRLLLVLSIVAPISCAKGGAPNNAQSPNVEPAPVTSLPTPPSIKPTIRAPVSNSSSTAPPRVDPSLPPVSDMKLLWAMAELPYFGIEVDPLPTSMSPKDAIDRAKAWFASRPDVSKGVDVDSIQAMPVRFTADPKFPEFNRLSWFLVAPPIMGLWIQGPPPLVATRDTPILYLWADDFALLMDDETGEVWGGSTKMQVGHTAPRLTINQFNVVQKYADSYGWWAAWYRLKEHNGSIAPQSVIDDMRI